MTTTPTQLWTVNYQGEAVLTKDGLKIGGTLEPATHDELIAAMPRCGTCGLFRDPLLRINPIGSESTEDEGVIVGFCGMLRIELREDFGCTEHKEKP